MLSNRELVLRRECLASQRTEIPEQPGRQAQVLFPKGDSLHRAGAHRKRIPDSRGAWQISACSSFFFRTCIVCSDRVGNQLRPQVGFRTKKGGTIAEISRPQGFPHIRPGPPAKPAGKRLAMNRSDFCSLKKPANDHRTDREQDQTHRDQPPA